MKPTVYRQNAQGEPELVPDPFPDDTPEMAWNRLRPPPAGKKWQLDQHGEPQLVKIDKKPKKRKKPPDTLFEEPP